jgi:hypothetical protein|eukprot:COSAG01_NODE_2446_length_7684_cov_126.363564_10_plen_62_part_00
METGGSQPGAGGSGPMHVPQCGITGVVWMKNGLLALWALVACSTVNSARNCNRPGDTAAQW